jgi:hypothetical protein
VQAVNESSGAEGLCPSNYIEAAPVAVAVPCEDIEGFTIADVGRRCTVANFGDGVVKFVGLHATKKVARVGVALDGPTGKNDGTVGGAAYFSCDANCGVLIGPSKVALVVTPTPPTTAAAAEPDSTGTATAAAVDTSKYEGLTRIQLIKMCKARSIDYKAVAKDIEQLQLLLAVDDGGVDGGDGDDGGAAAAQAPGPEQSTDTAAALQATTADDGALAGEAQPANVTTEDESNVAIADASSPAKQKLTKAHVGSRCTVQGIDGCEGTIRFVGKHKEDGKKKVGVEMDQPVGKHKGTVKGHAYFKCAAKHGLLLAPGKVSLIANGGSDDISPPSQAAAIGADDLNPFGAAAELGGSGGDSTNPFGAAVDLGGSGGDSTNPFGAAAELGGSGGDSTNPFGSGVSTATTAEEDPIEAMGKFELIKALRAHGVDYKPHSKDVPKLKELLRAADGGGNGVEQPAEQPTAAAVVTDQPKADRKPADEKPADETPADEKPADEKPADEYEGVSRLQLVKMCRAKSLDYKAVAKDVDKLKELLRAADGGGDGAEKPAAPPTAAAVVTDQPEATPTDGVNQDTVSLPAAPDAPEDEIYDNGLYDSGDTSPATATAVVEEPVVVEQLTASSATTAAEAATPAASSALPGR